MPSPHPQFSQFLEQLAKSLDIPDDRADQARKRYKSVGTWLNKDGSSVASFAPDIYSQGSFRLGTVIKPHAEDEEYDIDLVCTLNLRKAQVAQQQLKNMIGREIRKYAEANNMKAEPDEGQRCWTLRYADGVQFHMDILPAIPDGDGYRMFLESRNASVEWTEHAIAITDNGHPSYAEISQDWPRSNPKGYAEWFKTRMEVRFLEARKMVAESIQASIEDVPDYDVKTPLQQVIQILKRHRDISYQGESDDKPISIIITTLAAHAYNNEADILEALINIVDGMKTHIGRKFDEQSGKAIDWIGNPVNPTENFADKWPTNPIRRKHFYDWLNAVQVDLRNAMQSGDVQAFGESFRKHIGDHYVNEALSGFGQAISLAKNHSVSKFNVAHRKPAPWQLNPQGEVRISAKYLLLRGGFRFQKLVSGQQIPKECKLRFKAIVSGLSSPFKIHWQITNTGYEALNVAKCPRGGFYNEEWHEGKRMRKEATKYTGEHCVQCFIVNSDGVCIAKSEEFVVDIL